MTVLFWLVTFFVGAMVVAAVMPLAASGWWVCRIFDFPRPLFVSLSVLAVALSLATMAQGQPLSGALLVAALLLTVWHLSYLWPYLSLSSREVPDARAQGEDSLAVMVANLDYDNDSRGDIVETLRAADADVLLLLEVDAAWSAALAPLRSAYPHRLEEPRGEGLGLMLWSRRPIADGEIRFLVEDRRPSAWATVGLHDGMSVRIVGMHPTPPGLLDSAPGGRRSSRPRDAELILTAEEIKQSGTGTWVVLGDMNDVPWSGTIQRFLRLSGLRDPRRGRGLLSTFHAQHLALRYPLDHIFVVPGLQVARLERVRLPGSDHFGLRAQLVVGEDYPRPQPKPEPGDSKIAQEHVEEGIRDVRERGAAAV